LEASSVSRSNDTVEVHEVGERDVANVAKEPLFDGGVRLAPGAHSAFFFSDPREAIDVHLVADTGRDDHAVWMGSAILSLAGTAHTISKLQLDRCEAADIRCISPSGNVSFSVSSDKARPELTMAVDVGDWGVGAMANAEDVLGGLCRALPRPTVCVTVGSTHKVTNMCRHQVVLRTLQGDEHNLHVSPQSVASAIWSAEESEQFCVGVLLDEEDTVFWSRPFLLRGDRYELQVPSRASSKGLSWRRSSNGQERMALKQGESDHFSVDLLAVGGGHDEVTRTDAFHSRAQSFTNVPVLLSLGTSVPACCVDGTLKGWGHGHPSSAALRRLQLHPFGAVSMARGWHSCGRIRALCQRRDEPE
jgi:hypothetical protein